MIVRRPRRKLLQIEIVCSSPKESRDLVAKFGGRSEKLPRNWLERFALNDSKPIKIGKRLLVARPSGEPTGCSAGCHQRIPLLPSTPDALSTAHPTARTGKPRFLIIPASLAFGTGDHATTAMSLRLLEKLTRHWKRGWSVVDVGTGSGILALAASRFGASRVLGLDVDPGAILAAKSNARLNKIRGATFRLADGRTWKSARAIQVITANLYSDLLIQILPKLRNSAWLILSGILRGQETEFVAALRRSKVEIVCVKRRGKWIAILARNRHRCSSELCR
ncbi:MAG: 50S ribosomal protein L11 methyltransferase [Alphaproteobacteria bacterium]